MAVDSSPVGVDAVERVAVEQVVAEQVVAAQVVAVQVVFEQEQQGEEEIEFSPQREKK